MTLPPVLRVEQWREERDGVVLVEVRRDGTPGAGLSVDLDRDLAAPGSDADGRHPLPTPEAFAEALGRAGIGDDDAVVAHDDAGGVFAARLVWMLRATGADAALLDGVPGAPGRLRAPVARTPRPWPADLLAGPQDVLDERLVLVDARPRERFDGAPDPLDPRPGHLPGARSLPCRESLDETGRLRPDEELRERFVAAGVEPGADVVAYCGSGVTACHDLLVAEHLGLGRGRLYPGSWSQWASDPDRPAEV